MADFDLETYFSQGRALVDAALDRALAMPRDASGSTDDPARLREGMRYAVLQGGKRMRPLLTMAACEAVGGSAELSLPGGCALEMIHAYSLVHDDLPAMDDDAVRRGMPTAHVEFGEANAILIGDALLTEAFRVLAEGAEGIDRRALADAVRILAHHAGIAGMVGGQGMDLSLGQDIEDLDSLESVHALKTGGLYAAAGALGGLCGGAEPAVVDRLERYGLAFGIAFQHADDALDDDQPSLRARALERVDQLVGECLAISEEFGSSGAALTGIARWVASRAHRAASGDRRD